MVEDSFMIQELTEPLEMVYIYSYRMNSEHPLFTDNVTYLFVCKICGEVVGQTADSKLQDLYITHDRPECKLIGYLQDLITDPKEIMVEEQEVTSWAPRLPKSIP